MNNRLIIARVRDLTQDVTVDGAVRSKSAQIVTAQNGLALLELAKQPSRKRPQDLDAPLARYLPAEVPRTDLVMQALADRLAQREPLGQRQVLVNDGSQSIDRTRNTHPLHYEQFPRPVVPPYLPGERGMTISRGLKSSAERLINKGIGKYRKAKAAVQLKAMRTASWTRGYEKGASHVLKTGALLGKVQSAFRKAPRSYTGAGMATAATLGYAAGRRRRRRS